MYPLISIPLRDVQCRPPVGRCVVCGGELYPLDHWHRRLGGRCCPACDAMLSREVSAAP